jgi:hypothetical protein
MMQVVGERGVRIVPDVSVTGAGASAGLIDALLGTTLRDRIAAGAGGGLNGFSSLQK